MNEGTGVALDWLFGAIISIAMVLFFLLLLFGGIKDKDPHLKDKPAQSQSSTTSIVEDGLINRWGANFTREAE